jgi:hypothetical protein
MRIAVSLSPILKIVILMLLILCCHVGMLWLGVRVVMLQTIVAIVCLTCNVCLERTHLVPWTEVLVINGSLRQIRVQVSCN